MHATENVMFGMYSLAISGLSPLIHCNNHSIYMMDSCQPPLVAGVSRLVDVGVLSYSELMFFCNPFFRSLVLHLSYCHQYITNKYTTSYQSIAF